jgi:hypothetical protein
MHYEVKKSNSKFCPQSAFICFVCISGQTATFTQYIKSLVFITEMEGVYCAVRAGSLNETDYDSSLKGWVRKSIESWASILLQRLLSAKPGLIKSDLSESVTAHWSQSISKFENLWIKNFCTCAFANELENPYKSTAVCGFCSKNYRQKC